METGRDAREAMVIRLDSDIAAPPQRVWQIMGTVEGMKRWFPVLDEYEPRLRGRLLWHYPAGGEPRYRMWGEVVTFEPPRELAFTWTEQEIGHDPWPVPTLVTIRLEPHHGGTHVTLVHSGFEHLPEAIARAAYEGYRGGWTSDGDLERLKQLVEGAEVA